MDVPALLNAECDIDVLNLEKAINDVDIVLSKSRKFHTLGTISFQYGKEYRKPLIDKSLFEDSSWDLDTFKTHVKCEICAEDFKLIDGKYVIENNIAFSLPCGDILNNIEFSEPNMVFNIFYGKSKKFKNVTKFIFTNSWIRFEISTDIPKNVILSFDTYIVASAYRRDLYIKYCRE